MDSRNKLYSNRAVSKFRESDNRIFGVPSSYAHATTYQDINTYRGVCGEQIVANLLNLLTLETPGMYVFHSVGNKMGDGETDHVVLYKNKIFIIETKVFSGYKAFRVSESGVLYGRKGNKEFKVADNKIMSKVEMYQKRFPNRDVEAVIAVVRNNLPARSLHPKYNVVLLDTFYNMFAERLGTAKDIKEEAWPAVKYFSLLCLKS